MGTPLSGNPDITQLTEGLKRAESYWAPQADENTLSHQLLYNLHPIETPNPAGSKAKEGRLYVTPEKMRSGMGPRIIKRVRAFYAQPPTVVLRPRGLGPVNEDKAAEIKAALDEAIDQAVDAAGEPTWGLITTDAPTYGFSAYIVLPAPQVWFDYPLRTKDQDPDEYIKEVKNYEQAASVPIVWEHIPAQEFLLTSINRINDEGFWKRKVPAQEIIDRFGSELEGKWLGPKSDPYSEIDFVTYANRTHLVYFLPGAGVILRS